MEPDNPSPEIYIPEEWSNAAQSIATDFSSSSAARRVVFICGPKNSGKTTFSRHLLNLLLHRHKKVAYLDTDVGQSEFTPPGLLSITLIDQITPDLTVPCMKTPDRCFFFGDIDSKRDPTTYLNFIYALYDYYLKEYCANDKSGNYGKFGMPLVINTPGWVKGIGYDMLVSMLKYISPTHVVKLRISVEKKNLPDGAFWLNEGIVDTGTVIEISNAMQDNMNRSILVLKKAHSLRDSRLMAYFRQCFPSDMPLSNKELARALAAHHPYEIPLSSIKIKHLHYQIPKTETFYSLNATIVGLAIDTISEELPRCVGLGIVRGIDTVRGVLYLITPVSLRILEDVDLLLQGLVQIPTSLLQVQGCVSPYMSANVLSIS